MLFEVQMVCMFLQQKKDIIILENNSHKMSFEEELVSKIWMLVFAQNEQIPLYYKKNEIYKQSFRFMYNVELKFLTWKK